MNAYETEEIIMGQSSFEDFKQRVFDELKVYFEEDAAITYHEVMKPGVKSLTGLCIHRHGYNTCPTIYMEHYYKMLQNGKSFERVLQEIINIFDSYGPLQLSMEYFGEYSKVRDKIYYRLIGREGNENFLVETTHINYLDLAVIFYYEMPADAIEGGKINIKNQMLMNWGISVQELLADATQNFSGNKEMELESMHGFLVEYLKGMIKQAAYSKTERLRLMREFDIDPNEVVTTSNWQEEVLREILQKHYLGDMDKEMFILRTKDQIFGANYLYDMASLKNVSQMVSNKYYILPSSIHELIIIPQKEEMMSVEELKALVKEVNHTVVSPEEILSDSVYYFDGEKEEVMVL